MTTTRDRLLVEGMRLFGEKGYSATSVAQIEEAAGLSPGSGSLYKHFRSKEELLTAGLERLLSTTDQALAPVVAPPEPSTLVDQMRAVVRLGLRRMEQDRDLNRLLFRGLEAFPALLQRFGTEEIGRLHGTATTLLADLSGPAGEGEDWAAVAVALQGATAHYWLLADLFGTHPSGVDEERFVTAVADLAAALVAEPRTGGGAGRPGP